MVDIDTEDERLETRLRVDREARLRQLELLDHSRCMSFRLFVRSRTPGAAPVRTAVERAVRDDLLERVVQQHAVSREAAADDHVAARGASSNRSRSSGRRCWKSQSIDSTHSPVAAR